MRLVDGDLIVACADCPSLEPLGCLEEVGKMLSVVGSDRLETLAGLSSLRRVGLRHPNGGLGIGFYFAPWEGSGNARLRTLESLGPLEQMEGRFHVLDNPELRDLAGLAAVREVAGSFWVKNNDALGSLESLRDLVSVRGTLELDDNDGLVDLGGLENLWTLGGLTVSNNDALESLRGIELRGASTDLRISVTGNPRLTDASQLSHVSGTLDAVGFTDNASLREVSLDEGVTLLTNGLTLRDNPALERFALPGLTHVAGSIDLQNDALLHDLDLGSPLQVGNLLLIANGALTDTTPFSQVRRIAGNALVNDNSALERLTLPELQEISGRLEIAAHPRLTVLDLPALRSAAHILISGNASLPSCRVDAFLSAVPSLATACGNAPDDCAVDCLPRP